MTPTPHYSLSPRDRLLLVLQSHEGTWQSVENLMFDAGFTPKWGDQLTAFTSFYSNLCTLQDAAPKAGYELYLENRFVMLRQRVSA